MKRSLLQAFLAGILFIAIPSAAHAVPVGVFSWDEDSFFGAVFSVGNFSDDPSISLGSPGASFFDVFVDLACTADCRQDDFLDDEGSYTIDLGNIDPGPPVQTFEDFTGTSISSASLRLVFGLTGSVTLPVLSFANSSDLIDFTPPEGQPVPEPSTMFLLGSALSGLALWRRQVG